jgi:hypothetical protein
MKVLVPTSTSELVEAIGAAAASGGKLEIVGGASTSVVGRPGRDSAMLDMRGSQAWWITIRPNSS